jgi:hypothetical protein
MSFAPNLGILPVPRRTLWPELAQTPEIFTLYGGTALALRLGRRASFDFDFFSNAPFDPDELARQIAYLKKAERVRVASNILTCRVERDGPVLVSLFGGRGLGQVAPREQVDAMALYAASLFDLAGTKAAVLQKRAEAKDYLDIDALLRQGIDLAVALSAGVAIYGRAFNPLITLKALSCFDDGPSVPDQVRVRLERARPRSISRLCLGSTPTRHGPRKATNAMKPLPQSPKSLWVARRVVWFKEPEEALADPTHFLAHVMTYGTIEDLLALGGIVGTAEFREALENAPPGVFDERSWAYWNLKCGRFPAPPMPKRRGWEY